MAASSSSEDMTFPSGMEDGNFEPSDEQLVGHYLYNKVHGLPYSQDIAIKDFDLYGFHEPWQVFQRFGGVDGQDLYFFTPLKKRWPDNQGCSRIDRGVGINGGSWRQKNGKIPILSSNTGDLIGFFKQYRYANAQLKHHNSWIMHEYSLFHRTNWPKNHNTEFVLCRIRKK